MAKRILLCAATVPLTLGAQGAASPETYGELRAGFQLPDHAQWGEVPLWWWEGQRMTKERVTEELEALAAKGVKAVCPIQRSPGRCDPPSFSPEWWELFAHVGRECERLGMGLWAYDQVGYGNYGWLERAAAETQDPNTRRIAVYHADGTAETSIRLSLPEGEIVAIRAYPLAGEALVDGESIALEHPAPQGTVTWTPPAGTWRVVAIIATPYPAFYLSAPAADRFIEQFYGKLEETLGAEAMGTSFVGIFQDEHPPTPRDLYTAALANHFEERHGYDIGRAIPALHFEVGPLTPKYRIDFFDAYLHMVEATYWKRVFEWTEARGLLTSHDNWGRENIYRQSDGYIDYFRTQRWFSAPGYDDAGRRPLTERNYYDAKIAASIARLYGRPRVWNEAFHTSGWGRTTDETLTWLTTGMAFGANLYDEHGLYYATNAGTWEHAAPDPHWLQPYWRYYNTLSDFVARSSYLMSQGTAVVDAAVHYPVTSLLAGETPGTEGPDYNGYMKLSRILFDAGMDNDIIDDDSILEATVSDGQLFAGGNGYRALVFGPETTARRSVLEKALALAESGGTVLITHRLPMGTVEGGREDGSLADLWTALFGGVPATGEAMSKAHAHGGFAAFIPGDAAQLPAMASDHILRDFIPETSNSYATHRRAGDTDVYLIQNARPGEGITLDARFRVDGVPELWDPFSGDVLPVDAFQRLGEYTQVSHRIEGNTAQFFVFRSGGEAMERARRPEERSPVSLDELWTFSALPTGDNRWGGLRWPPSDTLLGPEVRDFRFQWEDAGSPSPPPWQHPDLDDSGWHSERYSTGPYWITLPVAADNGGAAPALLSELDQLAPGAPTDGGTWTEVRYSKTLGLAEAAPWGGHSGYPDGHIDRNFIRLPEGRNLLFTRLVATAAQRRGLRVELHNSQPRLWVNGVQQPFEDAVGNLPLNAGVNLVLLDLPDGGHGRLYVQAEPPSVATLAEAARGMVRPAIETAHWIWQGEAHATYLRKSFTLDRLPVQARVTVSAFSGFQLFVNGVMLEEEIGPWSNWRKPETLTITPHLRLGENSIAIWGQLFAGQNVNRGPEAFASRGVVAALNMRFEDGTEQGFVTDGQWKGAVQAQEGWMSFGFDDSTWSTAAVRGDMGDQPWGMEVVDNVGLVTETTRPLSIDLESPYLTCFEEVPDVLYDVLPPEHPRVGWYRFIAAPGLRALTLPTGAHAEVWVNGAPQTVRDGRVTVDPVPGEVSQVSMRLKLDAGSYGGAAFSNPIELEIGGGNMQAGLWADVGLPTYAGIGVYTQQITLGPPEPESILTLDLGQVLVAAEVFLNGKSAGTRIARPFTFDLTDWVQDGENRLEVHVANTIAPHYDTIPSQAQGPTDSGLIGPVSLYWSSPR